ncbi:3-oxoadipyl-CoA thiolase [Acinetobacter baumannii]|uniref:3-oxoadipyl-CoA thiolase n=1 Tax=Acinetobacter baumannii TaxID=470 RepID=UPI0008107201|nr:3-oxoadipyl-CoA thiolase [Acinetobacter baumannii]MDC4834584.1 3-oxoadipyl-CoA thiolase [Acinetobacter baumannii]MDC5265507.1 3-oxoadipyl-CoA thiolase [Acinetobacter baumannii]MDC5326455.1 3-oxoadipyl-CoA thiolase [Acinetobacter baumannii]MDC5362586.1 3-oxoadipyl-CoA thiolase [Acinetobacter baumannii]MDC5403336.1 3-oxoadipyl-CoA thiolase [Acinetobacter baumannii]
MISAYICDYIRTPIGRFGGGLSSIRADDLAAITLKALRERNPSLAWDEVDDVILGCANQAGEDNRNVARMGLLLAGFDQKVPGVTVNRLCGSGMDAINLAARSIKSGEAQLVIAGGVESMSRAPLVMPKADSAFSRKAEIYDTTIGWRFINKKMHEAYGTDSMPETGENVAQRFNVSRSDQDMFAYRSQQKYAAAAAKGIFNAEIIPVEITRKKEKIVISTDEHPRQTTLEALSKLPTPFRKEGTVTAGNASGVNDGSAALLLASEAAIAKYQLTPRARVIATASIGVEPSIMGIGPIPAVRKVLELAKISLQDLSVIELNEAFASQSLAVLRELGIADDDPRVNPNGGAIALGHPLGMSGARIVGTAVNELHRINGRYALCTMCVGVGQGIAMVIERL